MSSVADDAAQLGVLAEPTRAALYAYVVAQPGPVGREQAARALDIAVHSVKFHLDRLVESGLLEVEYRRIGERTGRGAGRPSKLYRRSARQLQVSIPPRRYDLVGAILASAIEGAGRRGPLAETLREAAHERGRSEAERAERGRSDPARPEGLGRLVEVLEPLGYEPQAAPDNELVLGNCPFDSLAAEHTDLVCGLNLDFVRGVIDGLGCAGVTARLHPSADTCCVRARDTEPRT